MSTTEDDVRDQAIKNVDAECGYTVEFAPDPQHHRDLYDAEEERLREGRLQQRMREHYRSHPPDNG